MKHQKILACLATVVLAAMPVSADVGEKTNATRKIEDIRKAAEQGDASGQFALGVMYADGKGVPQDYAEAVKWYRKAAEQGHIGSQFVLGMMYKNGQGVQQDYTEAIKWYRKAAEQGQADAQFNLGIMYLKNQGVPQDYVEAYAWTNIASSQGGELAKQIRDGIAQKLTPESLLKAQQRSREILAEIEKKKAEKK